MTPVTPSIMKCLKSCAPDVHYLLEPVQLLYVLMFSVSLIHMDKIYVDKVCQVKRCTVSVKQAVTILRTGQSQIMDRETKSDNSSVPESYEVI